MHFATEEVLGSQKGLCDIEFVGGEKEKLQQQQLCSVLVSVRAQRCNCVVTAINTNAGVIISARHDQLISRLRSGLPFC